jgi:DoxX-like family
MTSTAYMVVTVLWAAWVGFSAGSIFLRAKWAVQPLADYGVPPSWWLWLATAKAAGAAGLLVGLYMPVIGVLAATGLVLYFIGAVATVMRPRVYSRSAVLLLL